MVKPIMSGLGGYSQGGPVTVYSPGSLAPPQPVRFTTGLTAYPGEISPTTPDVAWATAPQWQVDWTRDTAFPSQLSLSRTTVGSYFNAQGRRITAASGGPRIEYNPSTGAPWGLLLEEQRTNLILQSSTLQSNANFSAVGGSGSASTSTESDATSALTLFQSANTFTNNGFHIGFINITSGSVYTFSAEVRKTNRNVVAILIGAQTGASQPNAAAAVFDFTSASFTQTLTQGTSTIISNSFRALANGNYLLTLTGTVPDTQIIASINMASGTTGQTFSSNGYLAATQSAVNDGFAAGAFQLELGRFQTSYIVTTTAAVTRNADILSTTDSALLADTAWEVEAGELNITSGSTATLLGVNTVTALGVDTSGAITTADGGTQTTANTGTWTGQNRAGLAWTP
jgi:hypothetical protein